MQEEKLSFLEYILLIISIAIVPLCFILVGDALVSMIWPHPEMLFQMYAERILFMTVSLGVYSFLRKSQIINLKTKNISFVEHIIVYMVQILLIFMFIRVFLNINEDSVYLVLFIMLNYLIAWEEEFVYRLMIPNLLQKVFSSNIIIFFLQAIIFSYIGHIGSSFADNLIYRFSFSFLLYYLRCKTGNIICSTSLHALWNIFLNYI